MAAVANAIRDQKPDIEITWIIGKIEYSLLKGLPGVNFIVFDKSGGLKSYREIRQTLKDTTFDNLFHMQRAIRASSVSLCISSKIKTGWDRERADECQWLFTNKRVMPQKCPHVIEGFFAFAETIGVKRPVELKWDIPVDAEDLKWAGEQIRPPEEETGSSKDDDSPHRLTLKPEVKTLLINAAASKKKKNWTVDGYSNIAKAVIEDFGWKVILTGGPSKMETELSAEINKRCDNRLTDLTGKTSLKQLLALIKHSDLVLAPDTGPLHMASTVGTPSVGLYAHSNPERTGPLNKSSRVVSVYEEQVLKEYGRPSSELRWGTMAKSETAMESIEYDAVFKAVKEQIQKAEKNKDKI
jgi:heptosyltransferase I